MATFWLLHLKFTGSRIIFIIRVINVLIVNYVLEKKSAISSENANSRIFVGLEFTERECIC